MTDREKAIVTLHTGYGMLSGEKINEMYKCAAELMNRPVYTHELYSNEVQTKVKSEFLALCADETPVIDLKDNDFGCILCAAVRYSLGRTTYMPGLVTDFIRPLLPYLNDNAVHNIRKEISETSDYGDDCDARTWLNFLNDVKAEIEKRGNRL